MGHEFGNLAKVKGVTTYSLSPYEQRAFAGYFSKGIPRNLSLLAHRIQYLAPFIFTYFIIDWSKKQYERNIRKDPKLYEEVDKDFE